MSEHNNEGHVEHRHGVFQRGDNRVGDDLSGVPHNEKVAEALVEDDFSGNSTVTAPEKSGAGVLCGNKVIAAIHVLTRMRRLAGDETMVTRHHVGPSFGGGHSRHGEASELIEVVTAEASCANSLSPASPRSK